MGLAEMNYHKIMGSWKLWELCVCVHVCVCSCKWQAKRLSNHL